MQLRSDWSERVAVDSSAMDWVASPSAGVQRKMLERDGGEVARATSIVRYAPGSHFSRHVHELGEELFVLDGEFCDETGRFGAGSYIRNPPGSAHAPWSDDGCVLFVKLRYFDPFDDTRVVVHTHARPWSQGLVPGLSVMSLHEFAPSTPLWCAGRRIPFSVRTVTTVARKSWSSTACSKTSTAAIQLAAGSAART